LLVYFAFGFQFSFLIIPCDDLVNILSQECPFKNQHKKKSKNGRYRNLRGNVFTPNPFGRGLTQEIKQWAMKVKHRKELRVSDIFQTNGGFLTDLENKGTCHRIPPNFSERGERAIPGKGVIQHTKPT